jgi:hypothetical protein
MRGGDGVLAVVFESRKIRHGFQIYFSGVFQEAKGGG